MMPPPISKIQFTEDDLRELQAHRDKAAIMASREADIVAREAALAQAATLSPDDQLTQNEPHLESMDTTPDNTPDDTPNTKEGTGFTDYGWVHIAFPTDMPFSERTDIFPHVIIGAYHDAAIFVDGTPEIPNSGFDKGLGMQGPWNIPMEYETAHNFASHKPPT